MRGLAALGVLMPLVLLGCVGMKNLKARAAYDLQCPQEQLQLTKLGKSSYGVDGCGRRATYVCRKPDSKNCEDWVLNSYAQPRR